MLITLKGAPVHTIGNLPPLGSKAPEFTLVKTDFTPIQLKELAGKNVVLNIFLSVDTAVCAHSVAKFNETVSHMKNTVILCVSMDLPVALQRFCAAENLQNVLPVSAFRNPEFGKMYGVTLIDGPFANLLARAIVVIDDKQNVIYTEQVTELTEKPNYQKVLELLKH